MTALHKAAGKCHSAVVTQLVKAGADLNCTDEVRVESCVMLLPERFVFCGPSCCVSVTFDLNCIIASLNSCLIVILSSSQLGETPLYRVLYQSHVQIAKINSERSDKVSVITVCVG